MGWNLPREQAQAEMAVHGADALEEESELYWGRFGATLTSAVRRRLPKRAFALPSQRKYPVMSREPMRPSGTLIPSRGHAIAAKGRALTALRDGRIDRGQYERIIRRADGVLRGMADE